MGQLRNATTQDRSSFPGVKYVVTDFPPAAQCFDARFDGINATVTTGAGTRLVDPGNFTGFPLVGETLVIESGIGVTPGDYLIISNDDDNLNFAPAAGVGTVVRYHVEVTVPPTFSEINATTWAPGQTLTTIPIFVPNNMVGMNCVITASNGGNTGTFNILSNTMNILSLTPNPGTGIAVEFYIRSPGSIQFRRPEPIIRQEASEAGAATIRKGGQTYIDGTVSEVSQACSITFAPI